METEEEIAAAQAVFSHAIRSRVMLGLDEFCEAMFRRATEGQVNAANFLVEAGRLLAPEEKKRDEDAHGQEPKQFFQELMETLLGEDSRRRVATEAAAKREG